jgi:hypothetical protein
MIRRDDDDFDENGLLKDGRSIRIGLLMKDHMTPVQRAIAQDSQASGRDKILRDATDAPVLLDSYGGTTALNRPGFRYLRNDANTYGSGAQIAQAHVRDEAYALHDQEEARRWQGPDSEIPLKKITGDACQDAYLAREEHDSNAWRSRS